MVKIEFKQGFIKKNEGCQVGIKNCLKYHENNCL